MNYIKLASNQRLVKIDKAASDKNNPYTIFNLSALQRAMSLKPNTFKLWCYLNSNQMGYEFAFSSTIFKEMAHMSHQTYLTAWNELVEKGYLEYVDEMRPNIGGYVFHEESRHKVV